MIIPKKCFITKGVGVHQEKLTSFELALRDAHIAAYNLVKVSSIFPPYCKIIPRKEGVNYLTPGQVVFCVISENSTNEPNRLISAAVGIAIPKNPAMHGYLSEHHAYGWTERKTGDYAEDLAATMLASTLGVEFDPNQSWDEREQIYKSSGNIFKTTHVCQSEEGNKDGMWTTVIAAAVLLD